MLQTAGTALQLIGALVTAFGLVYAWNRITARFDEWRRSVMEWREQVTGRHKAAADLLVTFQTEVSGEVHRPGTTEERLHRVENEVSTLLGQVGKVNEATEAAIADRFEKFDATDKANVLEDLRPALIGIGVTAFGTLLCLIDDVINLVDNLLC